MKGRPSGGITLAVSQCIRENFTVIDKCDQVNAIVLGRPKIAILVSYFQPIFEIEELVQEVANALSDANPDYHIVLFGEFNCRKDKPNEKQEILFDFLQDNSFICWNTPEVPKYVSHNGESTIDFLFMKKPDSLIDCELIDSRLFEHSEIFGTKSGTVTRRTKLCPGIRKCDPVRLANNLGDLRNQVWEFTFENVNDEALCVVNGIRRCLTRAATQPTKRKPKTFTSKNYDLHRRA